MIFSLNTLTKRTTLFSVFLLALFFVFVADSAMRYLFPIIVAKKLDSNLIMGLVLGFSSIIGLICDLIFPQIFKGKTWKFYVTFGILLSFLFPITLSLGANFTSVLFFLIASGVWGIYFEFIIFSLQKFIVATEHKENFSKDWGLFHVFLGIAKIAGPIVGTMFILINFENSPLYVIFIQAISFILIIFSFTFKTKKFHKSYTSEHIVRRVDLFEEFKLLKVIFPRVIPLFISSLIIIAIDAAFWTMGGLMGEELFGSEDNLQWLVLIAFIIPNILGSILLSRIRILSNKKKLTHYFLILSGISLFSINLVPDNLYILLVIALNGFFLAFAATFNDAVISDLLRRLGKHDIHLIALTRIASSLAYIIIPITAGALSDMVGFLNSFSSIGLLVVISSIILFLVTPKKLKIPHSQLDQIEI